MESANRILGPWPYTVKCHQLQEIIDWPLIDWFVLLLQYFFDSRILFLIRRSTCNSIYISVDDTTTTKKRRKIAITANRMPLHIFVVNVNIEVYYYAFFVLILFVGRWCWCGGLGKNIAAKIAFMYAREEMCACGVVRSDTKNANYYRTLLCVTCHSIAPSNSAHYTFRTDSPVRISRQWKNWSLRDR